jgi:hypothetical protein
MDKIKIEFAPGCFDEFDGTQEELDQLVAEIAAMVESGELFEQMNELTEEDIEDLPPEVLEKIMSAMMADEAEIQDLFDHSKQKKTLH